MGRRSKPYEYRPSRWRFMLKGEMVYRDAAGRLLANEGQAEAELARRLGDAGDVRTIAQLLGRYEADRGRSWASDLMLRFVEYCRERRRYTLSTMPQTIIDDYHSHLARQPSRAWGRTGTMQPESVRHYVYAALRLLRYGHSLRVVPNEYKRPAMAASMPRPKALRRAELAAFYRELRIGRRRRVLPLVRLGLVTGLRPGSLRVLRWSEVDITRRVLIRYGSCAISAASHEPFVDLLPRLQHRLLVHPLGSALSGGAGGVHGVLAVWCAKLMLIILHVDQ